MIIKVTTLTQYSSNAKGKYRLPYEIGKTVEALPGTLGIFCFMDESEVPFHIFRHNRFFAVKGIGKYFDRKYAPFLPFENILDKFYSDPSAIETSSIASNIVLFRAVEVIREVSQEELNIEDFRFCSRR